MNWKTALAIAVSIVLFVTTVSVSIEEFLLEKRKI